MIVSVRESINRSAEDKVPLLPLNTNEILMQQQSKEHLNSASEKNERKEQRTFLDEVANMNQLIERDI